jgi:4-hydroxybenzoate polyprenyltransferase
MYEAKANKVELLYLPAHSSHVDQPCDLGLFALIKQYFRVAIVPYAHLSVRAPIAKRLFLKAYQKARQQSISEHNIKAAFKKAGIWPPNRQKPLSHKKIVGKPDRPTTPSPPSELRASKPNEIL